MDFDQELIAELRRRYLCGASVKSLLVLIAETTGCGVSMIMMLAYFRETFDLPLREAMDLARSDFFPMGNLNERELDELMKPLLESRWHKEWNELR